MARTTPPRRRGRAGQGREGEARTGGNQRGVEGADSGSPTPSRPQKAGDLTLSPGAHGRLLSRGRARPVLCPHPGAQPHGQRLGQQPRGEAAQLGEGRRGERMTWEWGWIREDALHAHRAEKDLMPQRELTLTSLSPFLPPAPLFPFSTQQLELLKKKKARSYPTWGCELSDKLPHVSEECSKYHKASCHLPCWPLLSLTMLCHVGFPFGSFFFFWLVLFFQHTKLIPTPGPLYLLPSLLQILYSRLLPTIQN